MDLAAIELEIRAILTAPDVDLATISSKRVRARLSETFGSGIIKANKERIDAIVIELYNGIVNATGAAQESASPVKQEQRVEEVKAEEHQAAVHAAQRQSQQQYAPESSSSRSRPDVKAESEHTSGGEDEDEEDASGSDYDEDADDTKPSTSAFARPKPKPSSSSTAPGLKSSPQKRRLQEGNAHPPTSSPVMPLALKPEMTDEEFARMLQEEENAAAGRGGRATRGGGSAPAKKAKRASANGKKTSGNSSSNGRKKFRTSDTIDDSDEDMDGSQGQDDDDDSDSDAKPKKKRKTAAKKASGVGGGAGGGGGSGGYMKELALSEPLQKVCKAQTMARPTIVKELWAYIRENNLQNPAKKSEIINDDLFIEIFGVKTMTMFSMNKYLKKAVSPIEG